MKKVLFVLLVAASLTACQNRPASESTASSTDSMAADQVKNEALAADPDTASRPAAASTSTTATTPPSRDDLMRSLSGTYTGTLPCADCSGIETALTLNDRGAYTMTEVYKGKEKDKPKMTQGNWRPSDDGQTVELDYDKGDERVQFRSADGRTLKMLGREGKEIESKLNYSLTKQ